MVTDDTASTPMMRQYRALKAQHPDTLLFYRMGDFYELFFDDAVVAAEALDIALTRRGKEGGEDVAMCGVPVHNAEAYLQRLIRRGFRVAVCEQLEDPEEAKKRKGSAKLVQRDVVRVVTPGTVTEDELLDAREPSFLAALAVDACDVALAWLELASGHFQTLATGRDGVAAELARLAPKELLLAESAAVDPELAPALADWRDRLVPLQAHQLAPEAGADRLRRAYDIESLDAFGSFAAVELGAAGAVLAYVELTQKGARPTLQPLRSQTVEGRLGLDPATRRNLELVEPLAGERGATLLGAVDRTRTAAGARLLKRHLTGPLTERDAIAARHDRVAALVDDAERRRRARDVLGETPDLERALEIRRLAQDVARPPATFGVVDQGGDPVVPRRDGVALGQRPGEVALQQPRAGGGAGAVDGAQEGGAALAGERFHQLQIAPRRRVEPEPAFHRLAAQGLQRRPRALLGELDIGQHRARGPELDRGEAAEGVQAFDIVGPAQPVRTRLGGELVGLQRHQPVAPVGERGRELGIDRGALGQEQLLRRQPRQLRRHPVAARRQGLKVPAREFEPSEGDVTGVDGERGEKARLAGVEELVLGDRTRGDDADDVALDELRRPFALLGLLGVLQLLADGDPKAAADQPLQIGLGVVDRHAAHGDVLAALLAPAGQRDVERFGGDHGIVEEQLVEIAHSVEQQRVRVLRLERAILAHHRRARRVVRHHRRPSWLGRPSALLKGSARPSREIRTVSGVARAREEEPR